MKKTTWVLVRQATVHRTLRTKPTSGKRLLDPLATFAFETDFPLKILEEKNVFVNEAEVHEKEGDLWNCLEGRATFIVGGLLKHPRDRLTKSGQRNHNELYGKEIRSGREIVLNPGDWLWIPPGTPHQHRAKGTTRLFIIKIPAQQRSFAINSPE